MTGYQSTTARLPLETQIAFAVYVLQRASVWLGWIAGVVCVSRGTLPSGLANGWNGSSSRPNLVVVCVLVLSCSDSVPVHTGPAATYYKFGTVSKWADIWIWASLHFWHAPVWTAIYGGFVNDEIWQDLSTLRRASVHILCRLRVSV